MSQYKWDLFVSYARRDDGKRKGRVRRLVTDLEEALSFRFADDLRIFFDQFLGAGELWNLDDILDDVRESAILLALGSRNFVKRKWTLEEVNTFVETHDHKRRLILAELLDCDTHEYPNVLRQKVAVKLHQKADNGNTTLLEGKRREKVIDDLAEHIAVRLKQLLGDAPAERGRGSGSAQRSGRSSFAQAAVQQPEVLVINDTSRLASARRARVLLAGVSEDMSDEVARLRRHLDQFAHELEVHPVDQFPTEAKAFQKAFKAEITKAEIFVQLVGASPSGAFDENATLDFFQLETARAQRVPTLVWRDPRLDVQSIGDVAHRQFAAASGAMTDEFQVFCDKVIDQARQINAQRAAGLERPIGPTVFIDSLDDDEAEIRRVAEVFEGARFHVAVPVDAADAAVRRQHREQMYRVADVLVFVGDDPNWLMSNLMQLNKFSSERQKPAELAVHEPRAGTETLQALIRRLQP